MKKLFFAFALCGFAATSQATEVEIYFDDFSSYATGDNVKLDDWSTNGKVDIFLPNGPHGQYAGLDGGGKNNQRDLWQDFDLDKGVTYTLSFDLKLKNNKNCTSCVETLVTFGKNSQYFDAVGKWSHYSLVFTPNKTKSFVVKFSNTTGNEVLLDNIKITSAVPEPETYAMLLAGLGMVGMIARRRKQA